MNPEKSSVRQHGWLLLILIAAVFLRLYDIADTPPGLTHDEADHGITAWDVVNGARSVYFTVGYGREPLYDYSTALLMSFLGPTYLAGRLTAVFFSLVLVSVMYTWVRQAFDETTALLTAAGLAVGFWTMMTGRQSLRSVTLPTLFVLALYFFWRGVRASRYQRLRDWVLPFLIAGFLLGLTFYTYIPSRILWLVFPLMLAHLALTNRPLFHRAWRGTVMMLLVASVIGTPLFHFLYTHPTAEARIEQLSSPLTALAEGNSTPLQKNVVNGLGLLTFSGDTFWRYNIPGRPLLQPVMGSLFYLGLAVALWNTKRASTNGRSTAHLGAIVWLFAGMAPVLVTGPDLSTTQAIGMQPVLYLFPALGLTTLGKLASKTWQLFVAKQLPASCKRLALLAPLALFVGTAVVSARDYFANWANAPEVRVQYETAMVTAMDYLNEKGTGSVSISTTSPGRFHSPAVAQMTLHNESVDLRWFDGRHSLSLPQDGQSHIIVPGFAPPAPALASYLESATLIDSLPLRTTDLDRPLDIYHVDSSALSAKWQGQFTTELTDITIPVNFGDAAEFLGYDLQTTTVAPGEQVWIATLWRENRPLEGAMLFTHLQGPDGVPLAQDDRLGVPGYAWQSGGLFIQLHGFQVPVDTVPGKYPIVTGLCQQTPSGCSRLTIMDSSTTSDALRLTTLTVTQ